MLNNWFTNLLTKLYINYFDVLIAFKANNANYFHIPILQLSSIKLQCN